MTTRRPSLATRKQAVLDAMARVPDAVLLVVGGGPEEAALQNPIAPCMKLGSGTVWSPNASQ